MLQSARFKLVVSSLAFLVHLCLCATSIEVATSGLDQDGCGSIGSPCATLKFVLVHVISKLPWTDAAVVVTMQPGYYNSSSCGGIATRDVSVVGSSTPDQVVVDCAHTDRALFATGNVTVANMTVLRGFASDDIGGGAIAVLCSNTSTVTVSISSCVFVSSVGGAVTILTDGVDAVSVSVTRSAVRNGSVDMEEFGILVSSAAVAVFDVTVSDNVIIHNTRTHWT
jgi:hypothetical protein